MPSSCPLENCAGAIGRSCVSEDLGDDACGGFLVDVAGMGLGLRRRLLDMLQLLLEAPLLLTGLCVGAGFAGVV